MTDLVPKIIKEYKFQLLLTSIYIFVRDSERLLVAMSMMKRKSAWDVAKAYKKPRGNPRAYVNPKSLLPKEDGYVDLASAAYNMDTTGSVALIATIPQGSSVSQRVGKKVLLKSLQCRGNAYSGATALVPQGTLLVVYDKRPTGSLPAVTDILVSANSDAFNNDSNAGRFKILKRMDFQFVGASNAATSTAPAFNADFYLKLNSLPCVFKAAGTGAIADIEEGALYIVTVGTNAGTAGANAGLSFRTRYYDI